MTDQYLDKVKIDPDADAAQCHTMAKIMVDGAKRCPDVKQRQEYLTFAVAWYEAAIVRMNTPAGINDRHRAVETYKGRRVLGIP